MNTYFTSSEQETINLGKEFGKRLLVFPHNILIYGDIGSGKTRFVQGLAQGLGIEKKIKSPTYTLVREYTLGEKRLCHYDFYRLEGVQNVDLYSFEEHFDDNDSFVVVEWARRLDEHPHFHDAIKIHITLDKEDENKRKIEIDFSVEKLPNNEDIEKIWNEYMLPDNVRNHCKQVSYFAVNLAKKMNEKGKIVNVNLCKSAGMFHDIVRLINYVHPNIDDMKKAMNKENFEKWKCLEKKFQGLHHEVAAGKIFRKEMFFELAQVIEKHRFEVVGDKDGLVGWEEKLVYYSDKRVLHDQVVSLDERFEDSKNRHYKGNFPNEKNKYVKLVYKLEKEIFNVIGENNKQ